MKICTVGLGYIGLPTSIMFAKHGVDVIGVDLNEDVINSLNNGKIHITEPGLQEALDEVREKGNFQVSTKPEKADVFIIAVPTPNKNDEYMSCDLSFVESAVKSVIPYLEKDNVIIIESTIAPRTTDDVVKPIIEDAGFKVGYDVFLAHCPERVLPGKIMHELMYNNRVVGGITSKCADKAARVYETFVKGEIVKTTAKIAEMAKLMENTFRDVNIALANELVKVCNELEINALEVIEMANKHPRVNLHSPGPGVGGHCLPVDPYFIISKAPETAQLIDLSRSINTSMPSYIVENVNKLMDRYGGKVISILGLTYKGNVDDTRKSPGVEIYNILNEQGTYELRAYDPYVKFDWSVQDLDAVLDNSDLILILSDHNQFKEFDEKQLSKMRNKVIFDTKNTVKNLPNNVEYINLGNLYEFLPMGDSVKV